MSGYLAAIDRSAGRLMQLYLDQLNHTLFKRSLEECLAVEGQKLNELKSLYQENFRGIKFLSGSYFSDHSGFQRYQEIPPRYFIEGCSDFFFISHRWESAKDPDPEKHQFALFKEYFDHLQPSARANSGFWYDYSCIPQVNEAGERSEREEQEFANVLKIMHLLATLSHTVILFSDGYLNRSWCCAEWIFATSIPVLLFDDDQIFPFANAVQFRHLALVIWFLSAPEDMQKKFIQGEDIYAMGFLNTLLRHTIHSTEATYSKDKLFLLLTLHRHFWYHLRQLGLRTQLMTAFLLLERMDMETIEILFRHFIFFSEDADLNWTREADIDVDTMLLGGPDPLKDLTFHGGEIEVKSRSSLIEPEKPE